MVDFFLQFFYHTFWIICSPWVCIQIIAMWKMKVNNCFFFSSENTSLENLKWFSNFLMSGTKKKNEWWIIPIFSFPRVVFSGWKGRKLNVCSGLKKSRGANIGNKLEKGLPAYLYISISKHKEGKKNKCRRKIKKRI